MTQLYDAKYFSSRLLGQSRFFSEAGAVIDISITGDNEKIAKLFTDELGKLLAVLPVKNYEIKAKIFSNGINIALRYPYDLLMLACEILDWIWADISDLIDLELPIDLEFSRKKFKKLIRENQQILLRKLYNKALERKVNFFLNKDTVIIGSGTRQFKTKLNKILKVNDVPWNKVADIPSVLITGTGLWQS